MPAAVKAAFGVAFGVLPSEPGMPCGRHIRGGQTLGPTPPPHTHTHRACPPTHPRQRPQQQPHTYQAPAATRTRVVESSAPSHRLHEPRVCPPGHPLQILAERLPRGPLGGGGSGAAATPPTPQGQLAFRDVHQPCHQPRSRLAALLGGVGWGGWGGGGGRWEGAGVGRSKRRRSPSSPVPPPVVSQAPGLAPPVRLLTVPPPT